MEAVSLKLDEHMLHNIDDNLKENNYSTRTEFIRDAIRNKLDDMRREKMTQEFLKFQGRARKKTTPKQNKKTAKEVMIEIAREHGWED